MYQALMVLHVLIAVAIIVLVLVQQGKGADMGAAFGSGASGTLFGARGSASFLSRTTAILAAIFFITSLSLAYFADFRDNKKNFMEILKAEGDLPPMQAGQPASDAPAAVPVDIPQLKENTQPQEDKK